MILLALALAALLPLAFLAGALVGAQLWHLRFQRTLREHCEVLEALSMGATVTSPKETT